MSVHYAAFKTHLPPAEVRAHERTYHWFIELVRYAVLAHLAAGAFIVLSFFTNAGWVTGLVVGLVMLIAGLYLIRRMDEGGGGAQAANLFMTTVAEKAGRDTIAERAAEAPAEPAVFVAPAEAAQPQSSQPFGRARWVMVGLFAVVAAGYLSLTLPTLAGMLGDTFS
jgi:hypothetical protein